MCDLHQRIFVACPPSEATLQIATFFRDRRPVGRETDLSQTVSLALRAPVMLPSLRTAIVLQRDIVVTLQELAEREASPARVRVDWEPAGGGPFPRFHGAMLAEPSEGYDGFCLVLDGAYEPPPGGGGESFDLAVGHRIALATARSLLGEVRDAVERSYKAGEFAKRVRRAGSGSATPAPVSPP
ncbi:MAG: hypothetical protein WAJ85_05975 [Candidatus Baltobacteraceae bacterium]|jgi:hypothetical protein